MRPGGAGVKGWVRRKGMPIRNRVQADTLEEGQVG